MNIQIIIKRKWSEHWARAKAINLLFVEAAVPYYVRLRAQAGMFSLQKQVAWLVLFLIYDFVELIVCTGERGLFLFWRCLYSVHAVGSR